MSKTLIAYFSRTGEQYSVGNITKGNTAIVAEIIAEKTDGDLFEIKVVNDNYPNEYTPLIQFAKKEKQENARPEIIGDVNIDNYDTVFIGYPNWWAEMPMPVYTFLEKYNLSSKKVYKFCTHEGSGGVHTDDFALYGHIAQNERPQAEKKVSEWLKNIAY
jgi:flavodoxin